MISPKFFPAWHLIKSPKKSACGVLAKTKPIFFSLHGIGYRITFKTVLLLDFQNWGRGGKTKLGGFQPRNKIRHFQKKKNNTDLI
jgi:hypothetical protein